MADIHSVLSKLPNLPDFIKYNAVLALSIGLGKNIKALTDIPAAFLEGIAKTKRADTEAKILIKNAAAKSAAQKFENDENLAERALEYYGGKLVAEQINRDQVAIKMLNNLPAVTNKTNADKQIDEDWLTMFWNISSTKSKEDVQEILSKILASEVVSPGSISPKTIQILSLLTSEIGNSFQRFCNLTLAHGDQTIFIHPHVFPFQQMGRLENIGIDNNDLFTLEGADLIRSAECTMFNYPESENYEHVVFDYAGRSMELNISGKQLQLILLTQAGRELRNLFQLTENLEYTSLLMETLDQTK